LESVYMRISESTIRQIIREEISQVLGESGPGLWANIRKRRAAGKRPHRPGEKGYPKTLDIDEDGATDDEDLNEGVRNTHGYRVSSVDDVLWSRSKASIPAPSNPFVGGTPAFESWYNDGQMKKGFMRTIGRDTPDERQAWMNMDVLFHEGDHVIIPHLDRIDPDFIEPGVIMRIHHAPAGDVRGARPGDMVPLVNIRWQIRSKEGLKTRWLTNVGLAFLHRVAGPKGLNAHENSVDAMERHRQRPEPSSPRKEREAPASPRREEPESLPQSRVVRRVGGVASPSERPAPKPAAMSSDDVRQMLGLKRR
jgi:hypothetical protein